MKNLRTYMLIALLFTISILRAQNDNRNNDDIVTLVGDSKDIGGYGAISMRYFNIDNRDAVMFGGRGGLIIGHGFSFGLTGTGFVSQAVYDAILGEDAMLVGGYGGFYIEPIIFPRLPVHIALPLTIGGGGIGYAVNRYENNNNWDQDWENDNTRGTGFLLIEPGVEVEFNVMRHFRLALGASYKLTSNLSLRYDNSSYTNRVISPNALNGLTAGITLKFGVF